MKSQSIRNNFGVKVLLITYKLACISKMRKNVDFFFLIFKKLLQN